MPLKIISHNLIQEVDKENSPSFPLNRLCIKHSYLKESYVLKKKKNAPFGPEVPFELCFFIVDKA